MSCGGSGSAGFDQKGNIECPACKGERLEPEPLEQCPFEFVTADIWEILREADDFNEGRLPLAGGMHDQVHSFVELARFVRSLEGQMRGAK